jgi:2-oxoglutarate dehydrogenase E2 component (dihydrolipoamide succinyltransferase)
MSLQIKVPTVGESITEVTVASWLKKDGDYVEQDEIIAELESDKATFELPAEAAGILRIKAEEGSTLEIGAVICEIDTQGSAGKSDAEAPKASASTSAASKKTGETHTMVVPTVGESITEVTISNWMKADGDYVELDEIIAEVESDKATFELPAEANRGERSKRHRKRRPHYQRRCGSRTKICAQASCYICS